MGVGLRIGAWLSGGSGIMAEEFWEVGVMARAEGCVRAGAGVEARGGAWSEGIKSEVTDEGGIVTESGNVGGVMSANGGGAVYTATVTGESVGGGEGKSTDTAKSEGGADFGGGASI